NFSILTCRTIGRWSPSKFTGGNGEKVQGATREKFLWRAAEDPQRSLRAACAGIGAGFVVLIVEFVVAKVWGTGSGSSRRASHCSSAQGGGLNNGCAAMSTRQTVSPVQAAVTSHPNRLSINNGGHGGQENDGFRMDELTQPAEQAAVATAEAPDLKLEEASTDSLRVELDEEDLPEFVAPRRYARRLNAPASATPRRTVRAASLADGTCQLFVFNSTFATATVLAGAAVLMKRQPGVPPGALCPTGYADDYCGAPKYKLFRDAKDFNVAKTLIDSEPASPSWPMKVLLGARSRQAARNRLVGGSGSCRLSISADLWMENQPNNAGKIENATVSGAGIGGINDGRSVQISLHGAAVGAVRPRPGHGDIQQQSAGDGAAVHHSRIRHRWEPGSTLLQLTAAAMMCASPRHRQPVGRCYRNVAVVTVPHNRASSPEPPSSRPIAAPVSFSSHQLVDFVVGLRRLSGQFCAWTSHRQKQPAKAAPRTQRWRWRRVSARINEDFATGQTGPEPKVAATFASEAAAAAAAARRQQADCHRAVTTAAAAERHKATIESFVRRRAVAAGGPYSNFEPGQRTPLEAKAAKNPWNSRNRRPWKRTQRRRMRSTDEKNDTSATEGPATDGGNGKATPRSFWRGQKQTDSVFYNLGRLSDAEAAPLLTEGNAEKPAPPPPRTQRQSRRLKRKRDCQPQFEKRPSWNCLLLAPLLNHAAECLPAVNPYELRCRFATRRWRPTSINRVDAHPVTASLGPKEGVIIGDVDIFWPRMQREFHACR
uniref:Protein kinase domain-containing protein n=1 Tax=Macrostomum lignano TaxID=282301 RepID=A0A1I8F4E7_9PLAT